MANKTTSAATDAATYDESTTYTVTLKGVVKAGGMTLRPMHSYVIAGSMLSTFDPDKVASATPVRTG